MSDFVVAYDSPVAVWGQVSRDLRQRIERGLLTPGARLPTERELAESYGVNRLTVRQALDRLAQDGLIARRRGSGTFVSEHLATVQHDLSLTQHWRERVEEAGMHAASVPLETHIEAVLSEDLVLELELTPASVEVSQPWTVYTRIQKINETPIGLSRSWVPGGIASKLPDELDDGSLSGTMRSRLGMISASTFNVMESVAANSAEAALLETYPDAPMLVVNSVSRLADESILNVSRTAWLGSRVRFRSLRVR